MVVYKPLFADALNFITSNLDGSQLICREICCFEQLARKKYFAVKKENG